MNDPQWANTLQYIGTGLVGIIAWFLTKMLKTYDRRQEALEAKIAHLEREVLVHRMTLENHGSLPKKIRFPSPPPTTIEDAG